MLLSRFWYGLLACVLGAAIVLLYLAQSVYNRSEARTLGERLSADRQVVSWSIRDLAREQSSMLLKFSLDRAVSLGVHQSSRSESGVPGKARDRVTEALAKVAQQIPKEKAFDAIFAVDQFGRVVAHVGFDQINGRKDFDLGGYAVVADALRGWVRDDTLLMKRLYRVVARPILHEAGAQPAGAIVGANLIDARFAQRLAERTNAAVAFYYGGERRETGAPTGFSNGLFDQIAGELKAIESDEDYANQGATKVRWPSKTFGVIFSRMPGEAWELGAGFAVGRQINPVSDIFGWWSLKDEKDKSAVNVIVVALVVLIGIGVGLYLSFLEHTKPIRIFATEAARLAKGEIDQLQPSRFRSELRKAASDINDGIDKAVAKGGGSRRAADLQQVLGDIPDQPQMSAFSFPGQSSPDVPASSEQPSVQAESEVSQPVPQPKPADAAPASPGGAGLPKPRPKPPLPKLPGKPKIGEANAAAEPTPGAASAETAVAEADDPDAEWQRVFHEFVRLKEECGENTGALTFEKFRVTLQKNQSVIMERHGVERVKFSVYVKEGKAALKASPMKS